MESWTNEIEIVTDRQSLRKLKQPLEIEERDRYGEEYPQNQVTSGEVVLISPQDMIHTILESWSPIGKLQVTFAAPPSILTYVNSTSHFTFLL